MAAKPEGFLVNDSAGSLRIQQPIGHLSVICPMGLALMGISWYMVANACDTTLSGVTPPITVIRHFGVAVEGQSYLYPWQQVHGSHFLWLPTDNLQDVQTHPALVSSQSQINKLCKASLFSLATSSCLRPLRTCKQILFLFLSLCVCPSHRIGPCWSPVVFQHLLDLRSSQVGCWLDLASSDWISCCIGSRSVGCRLDLGSCSRGASESCAGHRQYSTTLHPRRVLVKMNYWKEKVNGLELECNFRHLDVWSGGCNSYILIADTEDQRVLVTDLEAW